MSKKVINYKKYKLRTCRWLNGCKICGGNITYGQKYYDGGYEYRAHKDCVDKIEKGG